MAHFNPRSPHGERHTLSCDVLATYWISIHAPRTGSDIGYRVRRNRARTFQSTLPARGATFVFRQKYQHPVFQSTLPARGATASPWTSPVGAMISIHAPRTGSDRRAEAQARQTAQFQSTLPARGATRNRIFWLRLTPAFQSTLPARGATRILIGLINQSKFQSTLPARGATRAAFGSAAGVTGFQSTLPARGATRGRRGIPPRPRHFNPRSPHGERHCLDYAADVTTKISIHAPRTGSDDMWRNAVHDKSISIHAPRTGSDEIIRPCNGGTVFQSTLPARGATGRMGVYHQTRWISIHAPRTGSDIIIDAFKPPRFTFQSTLPARGATSACNLCRGAGYISIHAPRTGSDA